MHAASEPESADPPRSRRGSIPRMPLPIAVVARTPEHATLMSDWTKVLLTNVVLSTVLVVLLLHAPVGYAALGAGGAGLALWARERRAQARRTR